MISLLLLIPLSILILIGAGVALFWAVDRGQFEDLQTPALLPLVDADVDVASVASNGGLAAGSGDAPRRPS